VLFEVQGKNQMQGQYQVGALFKDVIPFLTVEIVILFVITYFPWFTLTLPRFSKLH
jgi:TRAP-type C4-dicarboxylate transport system permease large subunit